MTMSHTQSIPSQNNPHESRSVRTRETKYAFNNSSAHIIARWLADRCQRDRHYPEATVSSIYYDRNNWRLLGEKRNSDYHKKKIRIRWYADRDNNNPTGSSYLEIKVKQGGKRNKIRTRTGLSGDWLANASLTDRKLVNICHELLESGTILPGMLTPVMQISYKRLRFIEPITGARLCMDYDIHVPKVNLCRLPRAGNRVLKQAVFEVKGIDPRLPITLNRLIDLGLRKNSFSKYLNCYRHVMRSSNV